jgi:hypothetical protein
VTLGILYWWTVESPGELWADPQCAGVVLPPNRLQGFGGAAEKVMDHHSAFQNPAGPEFGALTTFALGDRALTSKRPFAVRLDAVVAVH